MNTDCEENLECELQQQLEDDLFKLHGPIMTGESLYKALGYISSAAFRQALVRNTVAVPIFRLEHRRGKFALSKDVAHFLAERRNSSMTKVSEGGD